MNRNITLFMIALSVISFCLMPLKAESTFIQNQCESLDARTFKILNDCAEKNTAFLKGKTSATSIARFKDYYFKTFPNFLDFPVAFFSFSQSKHPNAPGVWSVEYSNNTLLHPENSPLNQMNRVANMLSWLKKNYTPQSNFSFCYLVEEPYFSNWSFKTQIHTMLNTLLSSCPLLISCKHPDLPWTKKGILIPDDWMLSDTFHTTIKSLWESPLLFSEKKSHVYFRGGLTGPKLPFSFENMKKNPRHYLLTLIKDLPYLNIGITDFKAWRYKKRSSYFLYLLKNFSHLKCDPTDFFEHAQHKYLLSCDGYGAAWSRVELIMATGSVLFLNAQCEQYFYSLMKNNKTHIIINKDFNNLDFEFKRLESNPQLAEKIGVQGQEFSQKFFSQEAIDGYLWLILNKLEYSQLS